MKTKVNSTNGTVEINLAGTDRYIKMPRVSDSHEIDERSIDWNDKLVSLDVSCDKVYIHNILKATLLYQLNYMKQQK